MLSNRASGILLHISSLPSKYGIGDLGPEAYKFVDFLINSGQNYWQVLPLNHTTSKTGHSPYNCCSAFAGNPLLLSPEFLYKDGLLTKKQIKNPPTFTKGRVDYGKLSAYKYRLLESALRRFEDCVGPDEYEQFKDENSFWLDDFATFIAIKNYLGRKKSWGEWPAAIRDRKGRQFEEIKEELKQKIEQQRQLQYLFYKQWEDLRRYCTDKGIQIIGDIPIYVVYDSPDVWVNPKIFKLDKNKKTKFKAGVPPDYFSKTGQLWGNPIYNWKAIKKNHYRWWMERMKHNMDMFDLLRIDHFRGLVGYWQIPANHRTAKNGKWLKGPENDFFDTLLKYFPTAPFIAEDLGYITADVKETIAKYDFPTMKVLQFGFDGDPAENPHIPHNHVENSIVYTGTHDNNTTKGWFAKEVDQKTKKRLNQYLGRKVSASQIHWQLIRTAMSSVADLSIIPVQDILGLGASARMNRPAANKGNWLWRLEPRKLNAGISKKLKHLTEIYGRL